MEASYKNIQKMHIGLRRYVILIPVLKISQTMAFSVLWNRLTILIDQFANVINLYSVKARYSSSIMIYLIYKASFNFISFLQSSFELFCLVMFLSLSLHHILWVHYFLERWDILIKQVFWVDSVGFEWVEMIFQCLKKR